MVRARPLLRQHWAGVGGAAGPKGPKTNTRRFASRCTHLASRGVGNGVGKAPGGRRGSSLFLEAFWRFVQGWLPQASLGAATLGRPHRQSEHLGPLFPPMLPGSTYSDHTLASDNILFVVPTAHRDLKYRCRRSLMRNRAQEATFKWLRLSWPTGPGSPRRPKPRERERLQF